MKLSQKLTTSTNTWIDEEMVPEHISLLEHLTVKLTGIVGTGRNSGSFTGTGVIARVDNANTYVLTAKHNLHLANKNSGRGQGGFIDYFKEKIRVEFTKHDDTTINGRITDITFPDGSIDDFNYDVAIVKVGGVGGSVGGNSVVTGQVFANAVRTLVSPARSMLSMYTSVAWQRDTGGLWERQNVDARPPLLEFFPAADAKLVLGNGRQHHNVDSTKQNFLLLQLGHGKVTTGGLYGFSRRLLKIAQLGHPAYLAETHEGYEDVFVFDATDNDTALSGDSGGPVFALDPSGTHSWLLGLHLGANFYTNKTDNDDSSATENNAFSVVTTERLGDFIVTP